jgi:hypothetical protein
MNAIIAFVSWVGMLAHTELVAANNRFSGGDGDGWHPESWQYAVDLVTQTYKAVANGEVVHVTSPDPIGMYLFRWGWLTVPMQVGLEGHQRLANQLALRKWMVLDEAPYWPLRACYGSGKNDWQRMISAKVETFSETEDGPITHIHFYSDRTAAKELWREIKDNVPATILSVSFDR